MSTKFLGEVNEAVLPVSDRKLVKAQRKPSGGIKDGLFWQLHTYVMK